jgi:biotin carboxyl carrier protein
LTPEAMKMETHVTADRDGVVEAVLVVGGSSAG